MHKKTVTIFLIISIFSLLVFVLTMVKTNTYVNKIITHVRTDNEVGDYNYYEIDEVFKTDSGDLYIVFGREIYEDNYSLSFVGSVGTSKDARVAYTVNNILEENEVYDGLYAIRSGLNEVNVWTQVQITTPVKLAALVIFIFAAPYTAYGYIRIKKSSL